MEFLSDALLIEAYEKAIDLKLNEDFIELIKNEMEKRAIH